VPTTDSDLLRVIQHEIGHTMGLGDLGQPDQPNCGLVQNGSTMNQVCNGSFDNMPTFVTTCDNDSITSSDPQYPPPPPPSGGSCGIDSECMSVEACLGCDENCQCTGINPHSPIIFDLGRDGYELTDLEGGVRFDLDNDGRAGLTAWTVLNSDDGFLALDRNENGMIDNGRELFGNSTPLPDGNVASNGWDALAAFDRPESGGNRDGIIDSRDRIWPQLLIWIDSNHDGISQTQELHSLYSLGIDAISLDYHEEARQDRYGNYFRYRSVVYGHAKDGAAYRTLAFDVFFVGLRKTAQTETSAAHARTRNCAPHKRSTLNARGSSDFSSGWSTPDSPREGVAWRISLGLDFSKTAGFVSNRHWAIPQHLNDLK